MNIAQIKRFVNSGLVPIDKMIGRENDNNENSLYSRQKKMLIDLDSIKQGIANIGESIANVGKSDYLYTLDGTVETIFQESVYVGNDSTAWWKIFQFVPEYSGLVEVDIQAPSVRYYAILEWGKVVSLMYSGTSVYPQGYYLQRLLTTAVGNTTNLSSGLGAASDPNAIINCSINRASDSFSGNKSVVYHVPVQKGQPVIGLSWGSATTGGYCVTEIKANKKAL